MTTTMNVQQRRGTDTEQSNTDSIREVSARLQVKCIIAVEQSDEFLRRLFQKPSAPSEIRQRHSRESWQALGIRLARMRSCACRRRWCTKKALGSRWLIYFQHPEIYIPTKTLLNKLIRL